MTSLAKKWMAKANNSNISDNSSSNQPEIKKVQTLLTNAEPIPQWQHDFCLAHAMFNNWRGRCPCSIDECLISKILDSRGHVDNLRGLEIGQGVTTDMVIDELIETSEPVDILLRNPAWWICLAEIL